MNRCQRARPIRNASAISGSVSASSQSPTSTSTESGATRRAASVAPKMASRKTAANVTGASVRRIRRVVPRMRSATLTVAAAERTTTSSSRTGRRTSSTNAGSTPTTMKALPGHAASQVVHWDGMGNWSASNAVGRNRKPTTAAIEPTITRSRRVTSRPVGNDSTR